MSSFHFGHSNFLHSIKKVSLLFRGALIFKYTVYNTFFDRCSLCSVLLWCAEAVTLHWSYDGKFLHQQSTSDTKCKRQRVLAWKWIIFPPSELCCISYTHTYHNNPYFPTSLLLPTSPTPYLSLIFIAKHSQRPPLPLTAHCCENMERGELNCMWDPDTAAVLDKSHTQ